MITYLLIGIFTMLLIIASQNSARGRMQDYKLSRIFDVVRKNNIVLENIFYNYIKTNQPDHEFVKHRQKEIEEAIKNGDIKKY